MKRRDFFRQALATSVTFATVDLVPSLQTSLDLIASARAPLKLEEEFSLVDVLTPTYWQRLAHVANVVSIRSLQDVQRYRSLLTSWLKSSPGSRFDVQLVDAISEITLVEATLLYDLKRPDEAKAAYLMGIRAAKDAGNLVVEAIGMAWFGNFLIDMGHAEQAHAPLEVADKRAEQGGASWSVRAWIAATQADAWAKEGVKDVYRCERALAKAEQRAQRMEQDQECYSVPYDRAWAYGFAGAALVHLGRPQDARKAQTQLKQGVRLLAPGSTFRQVAFDKDLVIAHGLEKNVEEACYAARQGVMRAQEAKAPRELQEVQDAVCSSLKPWKDNSMVKELMEEFRVAQQKFSLA